MLPREQPAIAVHHALIAAQLPPLAQQREQVGRQHAVALLPAFAALDLEQPPLAVDVAHLEHRHLAHAQTGTISDRQGRLVLQTGGRPQQPGDLVAAQHHWQLARMAYPYQSAGQVGPDRAYG